MTPSELSCCGDQCGVEETGSVTLNERIRKAAFQRLLKTHQPVSVTMLTGEVGEPLERIDAGVS